jgi:dihydrofolate reductase
MKHFKNNTKNSVIIMGRLTWESIDSKPLPNRINIVITSRPETIFGVSAYSNIDVAMNAATFLGKPIFIIGGSNIYKAAIPYVNCAIVTRLNKDYHCDTFFPFDHMVSQMEPDLCGTWQKCEGIDYRFERWLKKCRE